MRVYVVIHKTFFNGFVETTIIHISADRRLAEDKLLPNSAWETYEIEEHDVSGVVNYET